MLVLHYFVQRQCKAAALCASQGPAATEGLGQAGETGQQEPCEVLRGKAQSLFPGEEIAQAPMYVQISTIQNVSFGIKILYS